ncbi:MAG: hypothetical protein IT453_09490 [Planctomycetes bacterium]|nr:hypothetical protein [Planctomycetota bacterium]
MLVATVTSVAACTSAPTMSERDGAPSDRPPTFIIPDELRSSADFPGIDLHRDSIARLFVFANYDPAARSVTIVARYFPDATSHANVVQDDDTYAMRVWPTAIATVGDHQLAVASRNTSGDTVIELWTFAPSQVNSQTQADGTVSHSVVAGQRTAKTTLYAASVTGRHLVKGMCRRLGGTEPAILVQFYDSSDVYVLGVQSHVLTLVASPTSAAGVLSNPMLSQRFTSYSARELVSGGFVYTLRLPGDDWEPSEISMLVLRDPNEDGALDSIEALDGETHWSRGWGRSTSWSDLWTY